MSSGTSPSNKVIAYASTDFAEHNLGLAGNPLGYIPTIDKQFEQTAREYGYNPSGYPRLANMLKNDIATFYGICPDEIYIGGRGAVGVIASIFETELVVPNQLLVVPEAAFPAAAVEAVKRGMGVIHSKLDNKFRVDFENLKQVIYEAGPNGKVGAVFICNPNNPTGIAESTANILDLANTFPNTLIIISEANMELVNDEARKRIGGTLLDTQNLSKLPTNILVVRSFSKAYGLADDRIGYAVGNPEKIKLLSDKDVPFDVGDRHSIRASLALRDQFHVERSRKQMATEVAKIIDALEKLDFHNISKSDSNLILAGVPCYFENGSDELAQELKERDCSVVSCGAEFGLSIAGRYIRLTPNSAQHNDAFIRILKDVCEEKRSQRYAGPHNYSGTTGLFANVSGLNR